jgi:signal transduction histidine kinase
MERIEQSVLRGLAAFRWLAWIWMATVLVLARGNLVRPFAAVGLVGAAFLVTVWLTGELRRDPTRLTTPLVVGTEVGVALALQLADGFVYRTPHVFTTEQPLGVAWPIAAVLSAGVAFGPVVGAVTGIAAGLTRAVSSVANVPPQADAWLGALTPAQVLSLVTTSVMYALGGGVAGYAIRLVRDAETRLTSAERALAAVRAREDVARRLHDGVLQTLAIVERRADDPQLARLAREQELDLRSFLFGGSGGDPTDTLGEALRAAGNRFESTYDGRVEVLVPDDLPDLAAELIEGVNGAVGEALTNAGKHGAASSIVVYVEPIADGLFVTVRDDGSGFDPTTQTEGIGVARSIRGRIAELGGTVEVSSAPGRGTEVRITLPRSTLHDGDRDEPRHL